MPVGLDQVNKPTPLWVKIVYRSIMGLTTALAGWIALTHQFSTETKYEIVIALKFIDPLVYYLGQLIGENPEKTTQPTDFGEPAKVVK